MIRKMTKQFVASVVFVALLLGGYSCSKDDYLSEHEVRRMIEEALRQNNQSRDDLDESDVVRIIDDVLREYNQSGEYLSESDIRRIIDEVLSEYNNSEGGLTAAQIRNMIEQALIENNEQLEFTRWEIVNFTVGVNDWRWNPDAAQWEAIFDFPELNEFIYEQGAQLGYVFIGQQGVDEVQKLLPYINTYYGGDDLQGNPIYFTETVSVDYQFGDPSTVAFFIKDSQLAQDPDAPQTYNFRIVLIW